MKWMDTLRDIAVAMERDRPGDSANQTQAGWDPYDVWLTRIHRPQIARIGRQQPLEPAAAGELPRPC
ncbi:MAG: hypothetical protein U1F09_10060 [Steroidobacteraceae bacterium]